PSASATHEEGVAELRLAGSWIGEVTEWSVERLDARRRAGINHLRDGVVPEILLESFAVPRTLCVREHDVIRVPATDSRCLHRAGGGKIGRAEADAVHPWRCGRDVVDIIDAFGGLQDGVNQDRF